MMQHREYQRSTVAKLPLLFSADPSVVLVSPTGSGKSVMGADFVQGATRYRRVLWAAHRVELLRQARAELIEAGVPAHEVGLVSGVEKINPEARVIVGSVAMLSRGEAHEVDLIVVDEAHRVESDSYQRIIAAHPQAHLLGLTATPRRLDGKPLANTFRQLLIAATPTELEASGYISKPITYGIPEATARSIVNGVKIRGGDYAVGELGRRMMRGTAVQDIVKETLRLIPNEPTLVFAASREHGAALAAAYAKAGQPTEYLDGLTPWQVREAMVGKRGRLATGETRIVVNVDVLSEGFDCPPVKGIVITRATKSVTRFLQYCGRASRVFGNKRPVILDCVGNCWRHGLPNAEREWSLEGNPPRGGGAAPVKLCPACLVMIAAGCKSCPECGAEQPVGVVESDALRFELERLEATAKELASKRQVLSKLAALRGLGEDWVERAMKEAA